MKQANTLAKTIIPLSVICLCFSAMFILVTTQSTVFDQVIYQILGGWMGDEMLNFMHGISFMASKDVIIPLVLLFIAGLWIFKRDYIGIATMILFVGGGEVLNKLVKEWIHRERPFMEGGNVAGYSFPSGHSMVGIICYGLIIYLIIRHTASTLIQKITLYVGGLLILLIGISRISVNEHYPTDVLAGFSLGGIILITAILIYKRYVPSK